MQRYSVSHKKRGQICLSSSTINTIALSIIKFRQICLIFIMKDPDFLNSRFLSCDTNYVLWVGPSMLFPKYLGMKFMSLAVLWVIKSLSLIQEYCVSCQYLPWNCCRLVCWSEVRIKSQTVPIIDRNLDTSQKKYGCIFLAICPASRFLKL